MNDLFQYDREIGVTPLCGVDEAGRGPLAGDVYAAAVILKPDTVIEGLNDSKKLTEKKRELLFDEIWEPQSGAARSQPPCRKGRRNQRMHCGGLDSGKGIKGPLYGGACGAVSAVRL